MYEVWRVAINSFFRFYNVPALGEVANYGTDYFLLKIKFLAKRECELTTKFAIARNGCCALAFYFFSTLLIFSQAFLVNTAKISLLQSQIET